MSEESTNIKDQKIKDLDKAELLDIAVRQNKVIAQQSSQLIDLIDLTNKIELNSRSLEKSCSVDKEQVELYERFFGTQLILILVLSMLLFWLFTHKN